MTVATFRVTTVVLFLAFSVSVSDGTTTPVPLCASNPCSSSQYCVEAQGTYRCRPCDPACDGCTNPGAGPGNEACNQCAIGYIQVDNACEACPKGTFGVNCTGICHCLEVNVDEDHCNKATGACENSQCDRGWTGLPTCQTPCENRYGSNCQYACHCPPADNCSAINGLCSSGQCAQGWSGSGCQNQLPLLSDAPEVYNVTCDDLVLEWKGWGQSQDVGDSGAVIMHYELYKFLIDNGTDWENIGNIPHINDKVTYTEIITGLEPDVRYKFRVDVRQQDGDKPMDRKVEGKESRVVLIPCTVPTTTTTTTPEPGTTLRPPGDHLLDENAFSVTFLDDTTVEVKWAVFPNATGYTLNSTLTYYVSSIGDCQPIETEEREIFNETIPASGSFNISDVLPWRQYFVEVKTTSIDHGITDFIKKYFSSTEQAPSGTVSNIQVTSRTKDGGTVTWDELPCPNRGGVLIHYYLEVYRLPSMTLEDTYETNMTSFFVSSLMPFQRYGVNVTFVNSVGSSEPTELTEFVTLEDVSLLRPTPEQPQIKDLIVSTRSITVVLAPPNVTNGILKNYIVTVDTKADFSSATSRIQSVGNGTTTSVTISGLEAFRPYYIKVQAETGGGIGAALNVSVMTKEDIPNPPEQLAPDLDLRNETCIGLTWSAPTVTTGTIISYNVSYSETGSKDKKVVSTGSRSVLICDLVPGRYYDFVVFSRGSAGYSPGTELRASTEQDDPPTPPKPVVLDTSTTTIEIALDPVVMTSPVLNYNYVIFVNDVSTKRGKRELGTRVKRATGTSNETCPGVSDVLGYIARNFSQSEMTSRTQFIVGDGKQYGDYNNTALTKDHFYDIYFVITSYFEGICKYSFSKPDKPVKATLLLVTSEPVTQPPGDDNTALIIVVVVLAALILLAIIAVILFCCWRRRSNQQKYVPQINDEKYDLKVYKTDDYDPQKYWNTIYSIRESRYIVAGRKYLPNDQQYMNGSVGVGNVGPPIHFSDEFKSLPHESPSTNDVAKRRENALKNRFPHLLPYDHSRVILEPDENSTGGYINANFMHGYKSQSAYIAAQSPFDEDTVLDFWRMIYQYEVRVVVMMANLVEDNIVKCTQYWPSNGRAMYGTFILDLVNVQQYAGYCIRTIKIRTKDDPHWQIVYQFDLTYWPDHGVPDDAIPLLEMRHKMNTFHNKDKSPIVVHCGTGVSRTGVFIAIDSLLDQYQADGRISVYSFVRKLRKDRPAMVRTVKQYIFIYEAIFEAMVAGHTLASFDLRDMYRLLTRKNPQTQHSFLRDQFKCLQEFTRKLYPHMCSNALLPANVEKNRFSEVVPPDHHRPTLVTPGGVGRTDYINAVFLDSHFKADHFIITQTPLHTTVIDFWKLVYDHNVETIVMMENYKNEDDTCAEYWPDDHMKQFEPFFVETTDVFQQENITIRHIKLVSMHRPHETRVVRQFQFNAWLDAEFTPKSKSMLLDVMDLVKDWQAVSNNDTNPIIVHCKDGATHCGLFTAVYVLCEKMLDENEADLFHTVKHMKIRRNQIVDTLDQYRFCYKALWDFMNMRMPGGTLTERMSQTRSDKPYVSLSMTSYGSGQDLISQNERY